MRWWCVALVIAACKGGATSTGEGTATRGSAAERVAAAPDAVAIAPSVDASLDDPRSSAARCASACLYLLDVPLADARTAFARDCKATWPYGDDDCEGLLYARNCIYAGHGNVFKRPEWKQRFETQPWYRPKPSFKERDFSAVALANVRALVAASKSCGKPAPKISAEDIALATTWFDKLRGGEKVPDVDVEQFERQYADYAIDEKSQFSYGEPFAPERREIWISPLYHAVGPGKLDPTTSVVLVFDDKNQLIEAR
jgi:hypothetical protein